MRKFVESARQGIQSRLQNVEGSQPGEDMAGRGMSFARSSAFCVTCCSNNIIKVASCWCEQKLRDDWSPLQRRSPILHQTRHESAETSARGERNFEGRVAKTHFSTGAMLSCLASKHELACQPGLMVLVISSIISLNLTSIMNVRLR